MLLLCLYWQDLLTRHKVLVAEYLEQNYDAVSASYISQHFLLFPENTLKCSVKAPGKINPRKAVLVSQHVSTQRSGLWWGAPLRPWDSHTEGATHKAVAV